MTAVLRRRSIWIVFLVMAGAIGMTSRVQAITYGDPVADAPTSYPEVVSLWTTDDYYGIVHTCTATLIDQQLALTAAHCLQGDSAQRYVEVGASVLGQGRKIPVLSSWYNPRYSSTRIANDVAVVYLAEPANVPVVAKLKKLKSLSAKTKLEVAGWGVDQNGDELTTLHRLSVKYDISRARRWYGASFNKKTTIAAGHYFRTERVYGGACNGDSGGPLFSGRSGDRRNVVGVVSYGIRGCDVNAPTVFASVNYYWSKIQEGIAFVKADAARIAQEIANSPLTATIAVLKPYVYLPYWDVSVTASTYAGAAINKWCFSIDGRAITYAEVEYGIGDMPFSAETDGCFIRTDYDTMTSGSVEFDFSLLPAGPHQITATVTDSLGRTTNVGPVYFTK